LRGGARVNLGGCGESQEVCTGTPWGDRSAVQTWAGLRIRQSFVDKIEQKVPLKVLPCMVGLGLGEPSNFGLTMYAQSH